MLELIDWQVRRDGHTVLPGLSLTVRPGELMGLVGPSGAGKSTLLHSLVGRIPIADGRLQWQRAPSSPDDLVRRVGCSVLFYDPTGAGDLTVQEWLAYHAVARGGSPQDATGALETVGLTSHAEQRVDHLPSGLQERLLLARTELRTPSLALVDHPLSNLDAAGEFVLDAWLERLRDRRAVLIWASADRGRLSKHCDRLVLLEEGRQALLVKPTDVPPAAPQEPAP